MSGIRRADCGPPPFGSAWQQACEPLAALMHRFVYLKYALAIVLIFIGGKIFLHGFVKVPALLSLSVTLGVLAGGVLLSLLTTRAKPDGR